MNGLLQDIQGGDERRASAAKSSGDRANVGGREEQLAEAPVGKAGLGGSLAEPAVGGLADSRGCRAYGTFPQADPGDSSERGHCPLAVSGRGEFASRARQVKDAADEVEPDVVVHQTEGGAWGRGRRIGEAPEGRAELRHRPLAGQHRMASRTRSVSPRSANTACGATGGELSHGVGAGGHRHRAGADARAAGDVGGRVADDDDLGAGRHPAEERAPPAAPRWREIGTVGGVRP